MLDMYFWNLKSIWLYFNIGHSFVFVWLFILGCIGDDKHSSRVDYCLCLITVKALNNDEKKNTGVEPSPSSAESSPQLVPPPQPLSKLAEESCDAVGAEEMPAAASSSDSESRNSKIKVEEEFDAKAREESPVVSDAALDDSQEDPTPPKKKLFVFSHLFD